MVKNNIASQRFFPTRRQSPVSDTAWHRSATKEIGRKAEAINRLVKKKKKDGFRSTEKVREGKEKEKKKGTLYPLILFFSSSLFFLSTFIRYFWKTWWSYQVFQARVVSPEAAPLNRKASSIDHSLQLPVDCAILFSPTSFSPSFPRHITIFELCLHRRLVVKPSYCIRTQILRRTSFPSRSP